MRVPLRPEHLNANARSAVVLAVEVSNGSDEFAAAGQRPGTLTLNPVRVTMKLDRWEASGAVYSLLRFETGDGKDFATDTRSMPEVQDLLLAMWLVAEAVDTLLASARSSHLNAQLPEPSLEIREQQVLDVVATYQLTNGQPVPMTKLVLSFPPGDAQVVQAAVEGLIAKDYLEPGTPDALPLAPAGLLASSPGKVAAATAERLVDYITYRAVTDPSLPTHLTWEELLGANVAGADQYELVRAAIAILRLEGGRSEWWGRPRRPSLGIPRRHRCAAGGVRCVWTARPSESNSRRAGRSGRGGTPGIRR